MSFSFDHNRNKRSTWFTPFIPRVPLSLAFSLFVVSALSFLSPCSLVLCFFYLYYFLLHVFSYNITPPQFRSSNLSVSTHCRLPITTSSSVFLSTWPNHLSLASLIFYLMFTTPALVPISSVLLFSILFIPIIISTFSSLLLCLPHLFLFLFLLS